ncbi:Cif family virulence factor [Pedobacter roseus]|jgi:ketosteroid isomerase-like protein|uniref:Nuclear transport factor 2 family protein n=1 Tax=Pedobacter roseus TaxID=336820 RepID=A0A7G9QEL8_9SPHI|nr:nuclear transport factor 2 family protein [Pedobacter roseus]QNN41793.1 nuclear transport factor 2 family protein [Pedobacter roseus]
MKLKALVILLLGTTITNYVLATEKPTASHKSVINYYMDSYMNSDYKKLKAVLSEDAVFTSNRDVRVIKHKASEVLSEMKKNEGVVQRDCNISSTIVSESDALVIARIDINYELFDGAQQNFVIIEKNKDGEWKISQVYKVFISSESEARKLVSNSR